MKQSYTIAIILLISVSSSVFAENFIAEPKKKLPSCNAIKERCAYVGSEILCDIPNTLECVSELQRSIMDMMHELLEGSKQGFFSKASKEQLHQVHRDLERIHQELVHAEHEMKTCVQDIKELQRKVAS
ncbi:hypothetical protein KJZ61_03910 [Candidatus Dependentiae bacterium]|nr:hypothetical protein [Candidatus Dependentiae bacterium]